MKLLKNKLYYITVEIGITGRARKPGKRGKLCGVKTVQKGHLEAHGEGPVIRFLLYLLVHPFLPMPVDPLYVETWELKMPKSCHCPFWLFQSHHDLSLSMELLGLELVLESNNYF